MFEMSFDGPEPRRWWVCPKCWTETDGPQDAVAPRPSTRKVRMCPACLEEV
jgi:hypothetical protein